MRLLIAPRAAARRCSASAQGSSSLRARSTLSSWPITFLVRVTRSSFSREVCDIWLVYPMGVWYQGSGRVGNGPLHSRASTGLISTLTCPAGHSSYCNRRPFTLQEHILPHLLQNANSETNMFRNSANMPSAKTVQFPRRLAARPYSGLNRVLLVTDQREVIR